MRPPEGTADAEGRKGERSLRREWWMQRIGWVAMAGLLAAGGAGWLGEGPSGAILRTVLTYGFLLVLFRISGKRTLAQMTAFDFVLLLVISEATQQALVGNDSSLTTMVVVITAFVALDVAMSIVTKRWKAVEHVVDGRSVVIVENGKPIRERMDLERITDDEVLSAARLHEGLERLSQIKFAVLESSGEITIVPKSPRS